MHTTAPRTTWPWCTPALSTRPMTHTVHTWRGRAPRRARSRIPSRRWVTNAPSSSIPAPARTPSTGSPSSGKIDIRGRIEGGTGDDPSGARAHQAGGGEAAALGSLPDRPGRYGTANRADNAGLMALFRAIADAGSAGGLCPGQRIPTEHMSAVTHPRQEPSCRSPDLPVTHVRDSNRHALRPPRATQYLHDPYDRGSRDHRCPAAHSDRLASRARPTTTSVPPGRSSSRMRMRAASKSM